MGVLNGTRRLAHPALLRVIAVTFAAALIVFGAVYGYERVALQGHQGRLEARTGPAQPFVALGNRGVLRPPTSRAEGSGMRGDEEVVGVLVNGRARAYRLDALRDRTRHVVNDLIDGTPVSVAFCDLTDCVRAYTDPRRSAPLDLAVAGLYVDNGAEMVVELDGVLYFHQSGRPMKPGPGPAALPCDALASTRTTWKEWVRSHPGTDVYTGDRK